MSSIVRRYLKTAIVFLACGVAIGLWMLASREFGIPLPPRGMSAHTHVILVGFVMMVIGASVFQALWDFGNRKKAITTVFVLAALMNIVEGLPAHLDINTNIRDNRNTFNAKYLSADMQELISQINPKDYQAIIALPFYHQGSENFSRPVTEPILTNSIMLSYHTGLPLVNANLTRLSIQESKNCIALIGPSKYKKDIEQDLVDTRPFLLVVSPFGLNRYEQDLIGKAQLLIQKKVNQRIH